MKIHCMVLASNQTLQKILSVNTRHGIIKIKHARKTDANEQQAVG